MRARNLKPGFFTNELLAECSFQARLLFAGLWCAADRRGVLEDRPKRLRAELFPYDEVDVAKLIDELAARGFVQRYEVDGVRCLFITEFLEHQSPHHREKTNRAPDPPRASPSPALGQPQAGPEKERPGPGPAWEDATCHVESSPPLPSSLNPSSLNPSSPPRGKGRPEAARTPSTADAAGGGEGDSVPAGRTLLAVLNGIALETLGDIPRVTGKDRRALAELEQAHAWEEILLRYQAMLREPSSFFRGGQPWKLLEHWTTWASIEPQRKPLEEGPTSEADKLAYARAKLRVMLERRQRISSEEARELGADDAIAALLDEFPELREAQQAGA